MTDIATLIRRALAEVCTVALLLVYISKTKPDRDTATAERE